MIYKLKGGSKHPGFKYVEVDSNNIFWGFHEGTWSGGVNEVKDETYGSIQLHYEKTEYDKQTVILIENL